MRIFIASSNDLFQERKDFRLFLYDQDLKPVVWENIDQSITKERFQDRINEHHLNTSDIVVFMIKSKLGKYTKEEFEEACKSLGNTISRIYVYFFKESKDNIDDEQLLEILTLKKYLKTFGDLYQEINNYQELEHHFLTQIKYFNISNKEKSTQDIIIQETEYQENQKIKKICIYTASPLNTSIELNLGIIFNQFRKFNIEIHHKILNEDSLLEHYEFDLCFIFSKTNNDKIIIEDDYFIQKSITLSDLSELIEKDKIILILDKNIANNFFKIEVAENDSQIKKLLSSTIHKELKLEKGSCKFLRLSTELPELIDIKNLNEFVGRYTDIESLVKKISNLRNENKILTIKGSGGIGKTTLVSKVVTEFAFRGKFKDGIKFVQCEFIKDYEDFEHKISMAFDMTNAINFKSQLKEQINQEDEDRLIILDNVETILHLENTAEIKEFIKFISDYSTIIITSREKLNEEFEFVYELRELTTDEAEELFLKYYELKKYDSKFLRIEILENMLNNNPLAIKLVTSNLLTNKDLRKLKEELDNDFFDKTSKEDIENIFEKESDLNIERTKSLFNSINYSYSRLSEKEKLALELLSLFPDGIYFEDFKKFYNEKDERHKLSAEIIKRRKDNFSDRDLKSLEDKSLIINTNEIINLQSIIGRFADFKFKNKNNEEKIEYYEKAYKYNIFLISLIQKPLVKASTASHFFDNNKNNFLKCLDYIRYLEMNEDEIAFIDDLGGYFGMSSSPNEKIFDKLTFLMNSIDDKLKKDFFECQILNLDYFYGNFNFVYNQIKEKYPLKEIIDKEKIINKIEKWRVFSLVAIYGMEGKQFDEIKILLKNNKFPSSLFQIGEFNITSKYFQNIHRGKNELFIKFELFLNTNTLEIKALQKYLNSLYKTQFIDKIQSTYTLLKADKNEVALKDIKKLIITNPFTDGLKTLMLAMKDEKNCSKEMYEEAINKLFHIKYYYVEAILLYCEYLKEKDDKIFQKWFEEGKDLASKHYYRYLLHRFKCLKNNLNIPYDENNYPLPEKLDYSEIIKKYKL
ncbi:hypothetical protein A7H1H_1349 [Aliarcobacter butzleri 7h1h]|uniref:NB-ARC domain-containing protein n=1 Tax=Aliarcobacter butzleri TaxID=28197 RepID=UPI0003156BC8|nr:NB-ARC domain-containing protein [Aliarcobacter butzleri]AGR77638.1 hypothetical protein A7H1H_1349 [Aliarcobacter butzleri 7h1h]